MYNVNKLGKRHQVTMFQRNGMPVPGRLADRLSINLQCQEKKKKKRVCTFNPNFDEITVHLKFDSYLIR
jgi:hypothetical protein